MFYNGTAFGVTFVNIFLFAITNDKYDEAMEQTQIRIVVRLLQVVDFAGMIASCTVMYAFIRVCLTSNLIHSNLRYGMTAVASSVYFLLFAKTILFLYQEKILTTTGFLIDDWPLVLASAMKSAIAVNMTICPSSFVIERIFAIYYLGQYECKRYLHVLVILMTYNATLSSSTALFLTYGAEKRSNPFIWGVSTTLMAPFVGTIGLYIVYKCTKTMAAESSSGRKSYTLGEKFQIDENTKVFKLIINTILCTIVLDALIGPLLLVPTLLNGHVYLVTVSYILYEALSSWYAIFVVAITLNTIRKWKRKFITIWRYEVCQCVSHKKVLQREDVFSEFTLAVGKRDETDVYFKQLNASWS